MQTNPTAKSILEARTLDEKYISDREILDKLVKALKQAGYKIVLTQGVYDMFHEGHGRYLAKARSFGDILIVGIDTDALTRSMKGPDRPFDAFEQRIEILSMLQSVNIITSRDIGEHRYDLIKLVKPEVLVMSQTTSSFGDRDKQAIMKHCGEIQHLEASSATTTTAKLRRIRISGVKVLADKIHARVQKFSSDIVETIESELKGEADG